MRNIYVAILVLATGTALAQQPTPSQVGVDPAWLARTVQERDVWKDQALALDQMVTNLKKEVAEAQKAQKEAEAKVKADDEIIATLRKNAPSQEGIAQPAMTPRPEPEKK